MVLRLSPLVVVFILISSFFSCASGNIWLTVQPDGSGKMQLVKKEIQDKRKASVGFLKGGRGVESEFSITSLDVNFPSIQRLEMKGASFIYSTELVGDLERFCLLFSLDTSAESEWFQYFKINDISLAKIQKESELRDDLARFNNLTDYIVWEIALPGSLTSVKDFEPLGPEWWISNHGNRKAILKIPARDILNSRRKYSTYEVCSTMRHKSN
jgi:hypothetical protein